MLRDSWRVSSIGLFFVSAIAIGFFGGRWLDGKFHTRPWCEIGGLIIGIMSGFRELILISKAYKREQLTKDDGAK